jgi:glycosyltransferase involved in cell wall biosynthesis
MYEAQLAERCVRLLLVGDGPAYDDLYRYVEQYNLKSSVIFTGPVKRDEIPFYIAAMDIAVQPDVTDYACPIKIIEYMAMGKCIVAPDKPNIREILDDGITGFLFQPGNKKSLRLVLEALVENPDKKEEIGLRAREHIFKRDFLWLSNAQKVLSL